MWERRVVSRLPRVLGDFEEDAFGVVEVAEALAAGVGDRERHGDGRRNQGNSRGAEPLAEGVQVVDLEGEVAQTGGVRETIGRQRLALRGGVVEQPDAAAPPRLVENAAGPGAGAVAGARQARSPSAG